MVCPMHVVRQGIRESITQALSRDGVVFKYDISLPVQELYTIVEEMSERVDGLANVCLGFGHMGDGEGQWHAQHSTDTDSTDTHST